MSTNQKKINLLISHLAENPNNLSAFQRTLYQYVNHIDSKFHFTKNCSENIDNDIEGVFQGDTKLKVALRHYYTPSLSNIKSS